MSGGSNWNNQWQQQQNPQDHQQQQGYHNYQQPQHYHPQQDYQQQQQPKVHQQQQRMGGGGGGQHQHQMPQEYGQYGGRPQQQNYWQQQQQQPPQHVMQHQHQQQHHQQHQQHQQMQQHQQHQQQQQQWRRSQENQFRQQQQQQHQYNTMMSHPSQQHTFMFNANANVFVPRNAMPPPQAMQDYGMPAQQYFQGGYPQQQYMYGGPSAASSSSSYNNMYGPDDGFQALDAFAQFGQQSQQYMPSKELFMQMQASKCASFISEIQVGCEQLILDDDDSTSWSDAITQRFQDPKMDEESKRLAVKLIIEMAFSMEPNQLRRIDPQYTFSNLLMNLSAQIKDFLRQSVIPVLGDYHNARNHLENDFRVHLSIFYAECFVKLKLENGSRFEKIGVALAEQVDEILKFSQRDEYMKCLLRVFKVAGAEMDASETLRRRVDQILTIMGAFANGSPVLGEAVKAQIISLIECRQRGWDRKADTTRMPTSSAPVMCNDSFEDSTDHDLTEEQQEFLEKQMSSLQRKDESNNEIDDEVEKEFGKFVDEEYQAIEDAKTVDILSGLNIAGEEEEKPTSSE